MTNTLFQPIEQLISEYEQDSNTIRSNRLVMENYPKVLLLSVASLFEVMIKNSLAAFYAAPSIPMPPKISQINNRLGQYDVLSDKLYAKFVASPRTNTTSATNFYALFSGASFKTDVKNNFDIIRAQMILDKRTLIDSIAPMRGSGDSFDFEYIKQGDRLQILNRSSFSVSEDSFLQIKLRRNKVAHDYISGITDTFTDISGFYCLASLYVESVDKTLKTMTI